MQTDTLPQPIERQLKDLEARHQRHQSMLEQHREDKHTRRIRHRQGWHKGGHKACGIPVVLL
jgi:hypothetical protein